MPILLLHPAVLSAALASHDYILKIVPTVYEDKSGKQRYSYQYTVANKVRGHGWAQLRAIAPSAGREQRCQVSGPDCHWFPSEVGNLFWGDCSGQALALGKDGRPVILRVKWRESNQEIGCDLFEKEQADVFPKGPRACKVSTALHLALVLQTLDPDWSAHDRPSGS